MRFSLQAHAAPTVWHKIGHVRWSLVALLCLLAAIGSVMLYSAADGALAPWAGRHALRFAVALGLMLVVALTDIRFWLRNAYALYLGVLLLLAVVEVSGTIGMGAQRWVDLGVINVQPSELMKLALVLALARYYHGLNPEQVRRPVM
ncbi:MAG TPA: FtsW/RodA/SpoVE family cell cycle protein, partial [Candidatus Defluviicoccus seviourii]|nr:FtsW/RodA/SpoVE family cell cycle protein [Candidatus Defluviicoccus seviourii]